MTGDLHTAAQLVAEKVLEQGAWRIDDDFMRVLRTQTTKLAFVALSDLVTELVEQVGEVVDAVAKSPVEP